MDESDQTYSPADWWADSANAGAGNEYTADPVDLPGYNTNSTIPGTQTNPPNSTTDFPSGALNDAAYTGADYATTDQVSTGMDSSTASGAQTAMASMAAGAVPGLRQAVDATPGRTLTAGPGLGASVVPGAAIPASAAASPMAAPPALVNVWNPVPMSGNLAAELVYTDSSLLTALGSAAAAAGGQAGLMSSTLRLSGNRVMAGGSSRVGTENPTTASALAAGSEYGGSAQFHCGPWFFPAVAAWAASHPPPANQAPVPASQGAPAPLGQPAPAPLDQPAPVTPEPE